MAICARIAKQYDLVLAKGWRCSVARKVTGTGETNVTLPPGLLLFVILPLLYYD